MNLDSCLALATNLSQLREKKSSQKGRVLTLILKFKLIKIFLSISISYSFCTAIFSDRHIISKMEALCSCSSCLTANHIEAAAAMLI